MIANKYIDVESILSAFDHQIGQLIFGKSLNIFTFFLKFPNQFINWEQNYILDHQLYYCYYVRYVFQEQYFFIKPLDNAYRILYYI